MPKDPVEFSGEDQDKSVTTSSATQKNERVSLSDIRKTSGAEKKQEDLFLQEDPDENDMLQKAISLSLRLNNIQSGVGDDIQPPSLSVASTQSAVANSEVLPKPQEKSSTIKSEPLALVQPSVHRSLLFSVSTDYEKVFLELEKAWADTKIDYKQRGHFTLLLRRKEFNEIDALFKTFKEGSMPAVEKIQTLFGAVKVISQQAEKKHQKQIAKLQDHSYFYLAARQVFITKCIKLAPDLIKDVEGCEDQYNNISARKQGKFKFS